MSAIAIYQKDVEQFDDVKKDCAKFVQQLTTIADVEITEENAIVVEQATKDANNIVKQIENVRKAITVPLDQRKKQVMDYEKQLTAMINNPLSVLKQKLLNYKVRKEQERQAELQRLERERLAAQAKAEAAKRDTTAVKYQEKEAAAVSAIIENQATKQTGLVKRWTYKITDFSKLPDEYKMIDAGAVRAAINSGNREIPGLEIYQEESIRL